MSLMGSAVNGTGNELNDYMNGSANANEIYGLDGNDALYAGAGNDTVYGGSGDDTINGEAGADTMYGGAGNDIYYVDDASDQVIEDAVDGTDRVNSYLASYTLGVNVENIVLVGTAENGTGNELNNYMTGNSGNNYFYGVDGNDTLSGGAGNDTLDGGAGADRFYGGQGNDIFIVDNTSDLVTEYSGEGTDTVQSYVMYYYLPNNVENLNLMGSAPIYGYGNTLNNYIIGNSAGNILSDFAGNDTLDGGLGADSLDGGSGSDTYIFMSTDGIDSITEYPDDSAIDIISLTGGISETDPVLVKNFDKLYIFIDQNNYISVNGQFKDPSHSVMERIQVTDGYYLTSTDINTIINTMSAINNDPGLSLMDKYAAMSASTDYDTILAQSWHQP